VFLRDYTTGFFDASTVEIPIKVGPTDASHMITATIFGNEHLAIRATANLNASECLPQNFEDFLPVVTQLDFVHLGFCTQTVVILEFLLGLDKAFNLSVTKH